MSDLEKIPSTTESIDQTQKAQAIPPENFEPNQNQEENKQANDSFIQRISTKTGEIIDYIKTKTSNIQKKKNVINLKKDN